MFYKGIVFSEGSRYAWIRDTSFDYYGSIDGAFLRKIGVLTGAFVGDRYNFNDASFDISFSSDGRKFFAGNRIFDLSSGEIITLNSDQLGSAYISEEFKYATYQNYDYESGTYSIFIRDIESGTVRLLGAGAEGTLDARFSADGSTAVFVNSSSSLAPGDTNGTRGVFVVDPATGRVTRVSTTADGASFDADISPDGTKVVFASTADNLVANDTNGQSDIYLKDLVTGQVTLVSKARDGGFSQVSSSGPRFANDGTTILFGSRATDLTLDPTHSLRAFSDWGDWRKLLLIVFSGSGCVGPAGHALLFAVGAWAAA